MSLDDKQLDVELRYHIEAKDPLTDRPRRFLEVMAELLEHSNYGPVLDHYARVGAKCNRCASSCPVYERTGSPSDIPCHRTGLLLKIYERYFTTRGKIAARLRGGFELTDEHIDEMAWSFYRCTACRRCIRYCPFGLDHGLMTHLARYILAEIDVAPKALTASVRAQLEGEAKNTSAVPLIAFKDTLEFLEEELEEMSGLEIKFPMDVEDAEYIFFAPVSDYIMEADTLMGIAAVLHLGGIKWTIGSVDYDAINYGLFYNDLYLETILKNLVDEAYRLNAKKILIGECGHASRSAKGFVETYMGDRALPVINIIEVTHQLFKDGKIPIDESLIEESATYHDPCNLARSGWVYKRPREIVKKLVKKYVEMTPGGPDNYCCGGGGGTVSLDEIKKYRMEVGGYKKARQIEAAGTEITITPCANCKKQVGELVDYHKLDTEVMGLHDLILKTIDWSAVTGDKEDE